MSWYTRYQSPWNYCFVTLMCSLSPHLQKNFDLSSFHVLVSSILTALPPSSFLVLSVLSFCLSLYETALAQSTHACDIHHLSLEHKPCGSQGLGSVHSSIVMSITKESFVHLLNECKFQSIIKFLSVEYHVPSHLSWSSLFPSQISQL